MMTIFQKAALVIRLRLETVDLNYNRAVADMERLFLSTDPASDAAYNVALDYVLQYEKIWFGRAKRERSER